MAFANKVLLFAFIVLCSLYLAAGMPRDVQESSEKGDLKTANSYGFGYGYYPYAYGLYGYGYGYGYPYYGYYGPYGYPFYG
ncbi:UNVERIFIED_CONTAM: hypothetical protein PYX00_008971 [Menopon gallinae]|uniref:Uncharacterized protein n=1 Tax=Menopon gallinae TaxID=328185 RepID=A0AAW2H9F0_9NEOP